MPELALCPVCLTPVEKRSHHGSVVYFVCPRCGIFGLTVHVEAIGLRDLLGTPRRRSVLSYAINRRTLPARPGTQTTVFDTDECERILRADLLPTPQQQGENLIRWLGNNLSGPGDSARLTFENQGRAIEALSEENFAFVVEALAASDSIQSFGGPSINDDAPRVTLSFKGWSLYEQLRRAPSGRKAFIAMPFGEAALDVVVNDHFRPAVAETGFLLRRLDDEQPAGLIDDRLRLEIQASHFLIVELTHGNHGAYWEAGYAEGLGKPVIYTCEKSAFKKTPSHFDTNHHLHVLWNAADLEPAVKKLKATIRATIPEATRES